MTQEEIVVNNIKTLAANKGWSLRTLATHCKMSPANLSKVMKGQVKLSLPAVIKIAEGLGVDLQKDILKGIVTVGASTDKQEKMHIGIMSISNRRVTCVISPQGKIISQSILARGLDLADDFTDLIKLIHESIHDATSKLDNKDKLISSKISLKLVTQSYEFEERRKEFTAYAHRHFSEILLLPDWIITVLAAFNGNEGISLVTDKGVSLSYFYKGQLKKIGGWKYPVYDLGGENWLGVETIKHTIEAVEGYVPMSELANHVISKFNGKIERITEMCLCSHDPDIYCLFTETLLRSYFTGDSAAKKIIDRGFSQIKRTIQLADKQVGKKLKITLNGSLTKVYEPYLENSRLVKPIDDVKKVERLARMTQEDLLPYHLVRD